MTPQEKARDLVHTFYYALPNNGSQEGLNSTTSRYQEGIQCALIAVEELIKETGSKYWYDVKHELEKL